MPLLLLLGRMLGHNDDLHRHLLFDKTTFLMARKGADGHENEIVAAASIDKFVAMQRGQKCWHGNCVTHYWFGSRDLAAQFEAEFSRGKV